MKPLGYFNAENIINKSFDATKTGIISMSQDLKNTIDYNDSTDSFNKSYISKKLIDFLKQPAYKADDLKSSNKMSKVIKAYRPENISRIDRSMRHDSEARVDSHQEETNQSFIKSSKTSQNRTKGNINTSLNKEDMKSGQRTQTSNQRSISPIIKDTDLSKENLYFHTYDNEAPLHKKGLNYNKIANQASMKFADQFRRKANSALRGSKISTSNATAPNAVNQSVNLELFEKLKSSPSRKSTASKKSKSQVSDNKRHSSTGKQRKESKEVNKSKSFIAEEDSSKKKLHDQSKNHEKSFLTYLETKDTTKDSKIDTVPDLTDLSEKELIEMNSSLNAYYDLIIERDQANSRLLYNLKENFGVIMKEFMKNYQMKKEFDLVKQKYEEEKERSKKEKELLEFKLNILKTENERLKDLNMKYIKYDETHPDESFSKSKDASYVSRGIQEAIGEERKLIDLLQQREKLIFFMKAKEERYVSLLKTIESKGINVDKIYEEEVIKLKNSSDEVLETRMDSFSDMIGNSYDGNLHTNVSKGKENSIQKTKKMSNEEIKKSIANYNKNKQQPMKEMNDYVLDQENEMPPKYGQQYWERQFTEASNSKSLSQYSDSMYSYQPGQGEHVAQYIAYSPLEHFGDSYVDTKPVKETQGSNKKKSKKDEESPEELKGKLKLDLSSIHQKFIKQYHDEFMEKYAEFTSSWKRAMEKDKTFQHS